jgi:hypothetical protein
MTPNSTLFRWGDPLPSEVPSPKLENGAIVESESGVYRMDGGQLKKVLDWRRLMLIDGFKPESVIYLPDSLICVAPVDPRRGAFKWSAQLPR